MPWLLASTQSRLACLALARSSSMIQSKLAAATLLLEQQRHESLLLFCCLHRLLAPRNCCTEVVSSLHGAAALGFRGSRSLFDSLLKLVLLCSNKWLALVFMKVAWRLR